MELMTHECMKLIKASLKDSREEFVQSPQVMERVQKIKETEKLTKSGNVCG